MNDPLAWLVASNLMKSALCEQLIIWGELASFAKCKYVQFHAKQQFHDYHEQCRMLEVIQDDLKHDIANEQYGEHNR